MHKIAIILSSLLLVACGTVNSYTDGVRDRIAGFIESEERATKPDRVQVRLEYVTIPEDLYDMQACPPPVSLSPEEIARLTTEGAYNELFVAPLYSNNELCFLSMRRIERYNDSVEERNPK